MIIWILDEISECQDMSISTTSSSILHGLPTGEARNIVPPSEIMGLFRYFPIIEESPTFLN